MVRSEERRVEWGEGEKRRGGEWGGRGREREREMCSQPRPQDTLAFFLMPLNFRRRFTCHLLHIVIAFFII